MIQFLSNNLVTNSNITASTENAQFPVTNINDPRRTKTYRSTSNSDNIVIDLGGADAVDTFAIVDNFKTGFTVSTITLEANGTDVWTSPAFTTTVTLDDTFGVAIKQFTEVNYRFWRIVLTGTLGYCEISNIFLGKATKLTTNGLSYNWNYSNMDLSKKSTNRDGQEFFDVVTPRKELTNLQFQVFDKDEIDTVLGVYDSNLTYNPFFIYLPLETESLFNNDDRFNGMYRFSSAPQMTNTTSGYYNITLNLREAK